MACLTNAMEAVMERFEKAVRADEMRGAQDTEDAVLIEEEYHAAKAELAECLAWVP